MTLGIVSAIAGAVCLFSPAWGVIALVFGTELWLPSSASTT